ncbi:MAG: ABC transporter permease [Clostridia bacterium]|nr:ABC transporter permease [Clostridia bacterium]MBR5428143.1 ABC transporter permease [Clostridia bacterium]
MLENIALSFQGIWSHKMRSLLTMLGIIIGIASIISIVSNIQGTNEQIKQNLVGAGSNTVTVSLTQEDGDYDPAYSALPQGVSVISEETRASLEQIENVEGAALFRVRGYAENVYFRNSAFSGALYGVDRYYLGVNGYSVAAGRAILQSDIDACRKIVLVDDVAGGKLFQGENPVGQTLEIRGEPFTVAGVVARSDASAPKIGSVSDYMMYAGSSAGALFIPESCWPIIYRFDEPQSVSVKARSADDMTGVGKAVADSLNASQVVSGTVKYASDDLMRQAAQLQELASASSRQLVWIAGISLLVGGIGVMNIMMVSVTERTREIGLKKALGARRRRILSQFLTEAAVLTGVGGLFGVLAGLGLAKLMSFISDAPWAVSVPACIVAVAFSTVIGLVFGLVPAVKASNLNPIDALNRE